jgi:hypothetical protein
MNNEAERYCKTCNCIYTLPLNLLFMTADSYAVLYPQPSAYKLQGRVITTGNKGYLIAEGPSSTDGDAQGNHVAYDFW